jgi:hypothetical protein
MTQTIIAHNVFKKFGKPEGFIAMDSLEGL